jgi:hypothetical protein
MSQFVAAVVRVQVVLRPVLLQVLLRVLRGVPRPVKIKNDGWNRMVTQTK